MANMKERDGEFSLDCSRQDQGRSRFNLMANMKERDGVLSLDCSHQDQDIYPPLPQWLHFLSIKYLVSGRLCTARAHMSCFSHTVLVQKQVTYGEPGNSKKQPAEEASI